MRDIFLGALIGYGACLLLTTPQGRGMVGSARKTLSSVEASLGKHLNEKKDEGKAKDGTCT